MLMVTSAAQGDRGLDHRDTGLSLLRGVAASVGVDDTSGKELLRRPDPPGAVAPGPLSSVRRQSRPAPGLLATSSPGRGRPDRVRPAWSGQRGWLRRGRERAGWLHAELANAAEQVPDHRLGLTVPPATPLGTGHRGCRPGVRGLPPLPGHRPAVAVAAGQSTHRRPTPCRRYRADLIPRTSQGGTLPEAAPT